MTAMTAPRRPRSAAPARGGIRIGLYLYGLSGGGAQRRTLTLANGFAERGYDVDLLVADPDGVLMPDLSGDVRVVTLGSPLLRTLISVKAKRSLRMAAAARELVRYLRREPPNVLMSAASHAHLSALWVRRFSSAAVPLVIRASNHLSGSSWNRKRVPMPEKWLAARWLYHRADAVIAVSRGVADDLERRIGVPRSRITVVPNPTFTADLAAKAREPVDHPWLGQDDVPVILGAGRLMRQKDFPTLLKAFVRVRAVRPARLIVIGDGPREDALQGMAERLGIAQDVAFPGFVQNPYPWMAGASLFVLSSAWEGMPGALIEAMACGCPVVSTDCPSGPAEILEDGRYGPLVPVGDDAAMAEAILKTLADPPPTEQLRSRAAAFSPDVAVPRYLEVLEAVAAAGSRPLASTGAKARAA